MRRTVQFLTVYLVASLVLSGLMLLQAYPQRPQSPTGWIVLLTLALPITLVGEAVGELLFRNRLSRTVERVTENRSFSWVRIGYVLVLALLVIVALVMVVQVLPRGWRIDEL
jgi:hypothetical protein